MDDGREVGVDLKAYGHVDHGYAATIHKAQGVTVDRAHVLATPGLDRHAAYVALSRHRDGVALHWGADDFADRQALDRTWGGSGPRTPRWTTPRPLLSGATYTCRSSCSGPHPSQSR